MNEKEYWITAESFGDIIPENWEEIADYLNTIIREEGLQNDVNAVNDLWDDYWNYRTGMRHNRHENHN